MLYPPFTVELKQLEMNDLSRDYPLAVLMVKIFTDIMCRV